MIFDRFLNSFHLKDWEEGFRRVKGSKEGNVSTYEHHSKEGVKGWHHEKGSHVVGKGSSASNEHLSHEEYENDLLFLSKIKHLKKSMNFS